MCFLFVENFNLLLNNRFRSSKNNYLYKKLSDFRTDGTCILSIAYSVFNNFITLYTKPIMKFKLIYLIVIITFPFGILTGQVDIQPDAIGINTTNPLSTLAINDEGFSHVTAYIRSKANVNSSTGLRVDAKALNGFGNQTFGIYAEANLRALPIFSYAMRGVSVRKQASNDGRAYGVHGIAGNATPGANYGVLGELQGSNNGAAILGHDRVGQGSWGQVLPNGVSYGAYIRGKGYFHDNLGLGEEDPKAKLHVQGGDVYVEGNANGIILDAGGSNCFRITVDGSGTLTTTSVTCPN